VRTEDTGKSVAVRETGMGLEAAVRISGPAACPVAEASDRAGTRIGSVSRTNTAGEVIEEFELESDAEDVEGTEGAEKVFDDDRYSVYRFERDPAAPCFCDRIEDFGCPIADISSEDGDLCVVFRPTDVETLKEIVGTLQEEFGEIKLEHLVRSGDPTEVDPVVVDRGRLTDRQREVLETAYRMGYFEHPKGANAGEVAAELDINSATFRGHLAAAQSKLFESIVGGDPETV
jgi:predicted DNA binding protein